MQAVEVILFNFLSTIRPVVTYQKSLPMISVNCVTPSGGNILYMTYTYRVSLISETDEVCAQHDTK